MQPIAAEPGRPARAAPLGRCALLLLGLGAVAGFAALLPPGSEATLVPVLAVTVAAFVSSVAGFAFAAISGAMLFQVMPNPTRVVPLIMLCSIANQALAVWTLRRSIDFAAMRPFLIAALPGVPVGAFLLLHVDPKTYLRALGVLLIAWAAYQTGGRPVRPRHTTLAGDFGCGFVSGVLGGFSGFAGALIAIRCGRKGWDKTRQRGVYQPIIIILQLTALGCIALLRPATGPPAIGVDSLAFLPGSLLGTAGGLLLFKRLTDRQFTLALNALLALSGAALVL